MKNIIEIVVAVVLVTSCRDSITEIGTDASAIYTCQSGPLPITMDTIVSEASWTYCTAVNECDDQVIVEDCVTDQTEAICLAVDCAFESLVNDYFWTGCMTAISSMTCDELGTGAAPDECKCSSLFCSFQMDGLMCEGDVL